MNRKVADSGDEVIQKQGSSIFDTHEPAIAMHLSPYGLYMMDAKSYKNQIFLVGRHQGVYRFVSPGLHHITSASSHSGMLRNEIFTSILSGSFLPSPATILCHQQALRMAIYWGRYLGVARKWRRGEGGTGIWWGDLMRGTPFG
jgi:hypothetical protein